MAGEYRCRIPNQIVIFYSVYSKDGRVPGGTIFLSRERTERSRTIPSFRKNERLEHVLKNIGILVKERNGTEIA